MASLETIVYFEFFTIDKSKKFIRDNNDKLCIQEQIYNICILLDTIGN